jgi:hypothetical protein
MVSAQARRLAGPRKRNGLDPVTTSRLPEIAHRLYNGNPQTAARGTCQYFHDRGNLFTYAVNKLTR